MILNHYQLNLNLLNIENVLNHQANLNKYKYYKVYHSDVSQIKVFGKSVETGRSVSVNISI